jgi:hypothetical protein
MPFIAAAFALCLLYALATAQTPPATSRSSPPLGTLSDKLDRSEGVIKPPAGIDPDIQKPAPAPNPGVMPVIPPPGEPGGRQDIQPK